MSTWNPADLESIDSEQELTLIAGDRTVIIWMASANNRLFVRPVNGHASPWYRSAIGAGTGSITAGSKTVDVTISEPDLDEGLVEQLDATYSRKYHQYAHNFLPPVMTPKAKAATLEFTPQRRRIDI